MNTNHTTPESLWSRLEAALTLTDYVEVFTDVLRAEANGMISSDHATYMLRNMNDTLVEYFQKLSAFNRAPSRVCRILVLDQCNRPYSLARLLMCSVLAKALYCETAG